jgi:hypothetical protein
MVGKDSGILWSQEPNFLVRYGDDLGDECNLHIYRSRCSSFQLILISSSSLLAAYLDLI